MRKIIPGLFMLAVAVLTVAAEEPSGSIFSVIEKYSSIIRDDGNDWTIAHCAAAFGTPEEMKSVIDSSDLMDEPDALGNTPMIISALYGNIGTFLVLAENGCDMKAVNNRGGNCAVYIGRFSSADRDEALSLISEYGDTDMTATNGMSPLHYSVHGGDYGLTEKLISFGADMEKEEYITGLRPIDMARFITFQYTDLIEITDDDIRLENKLVDLLLDSGSRNKSYLPMSVSVFGNFFFNIFIAIDSISEKDVEMDQVNRAGYYDYVTVNGSENPLIPFERMEKMFRDAGIDVELEVHRDNFEKIIDDCNASEDLYMIMANMSGHPYIRNHWILIIERYKKGGYKDFLRVYESSQLFEPMFYQVKDIGTMITIKVNR